MKTSPVDVGPYSSMDITLVLDNQSPSTPTSRMDISTVLNPSEELALKDEPMEVDSTTPPTSRHHSSPDSGSTVESAEAVSPQCSRVYPHRLPPMQSTPTTSVNDEARSDNTLPPLRILIQNIGPPPLLESEKLDYCAQIDMLEFQNRAQLNCRPSRIRHSQSTEGIMRTFNDYEPQSLLADEDTRTRLARRNSHHSPRSPRSPHHRIFRRGSQPQSVWSIPIRHAPGDRYRYHQPAIVTKDPATHYDSPSLVPKPKSKSAHSNKLYTPEQLDWIRYHRVDRGMAFKSDMMPLFFAEFPERYDPYATEQILSSRYYRDNKRPWLDDEGMWDVDAQGNIKLVSAKVRDRSTAEGKKLDFPASLVDKWPARLLCERYQRWKSPILEEDRERARQILAGNDVNDPLGKRAEWRRILCECEHLIYKIQPGEDS